MFRYITVKTIHNVIRESKDIQKKARREKSFEGSEVVVDIFSADHFSLVLNMLFVHIKIIDVLLVIFSVFGLIFLTSGAVDYALIFFGMALFCFLYLFFLAFMRSVAHIKTSKTGYGFAQSGLYVKDENGYLCLPWNDVRVRKTTKHFFLYFSPFGALIIPKGSISEEQIAMIEDFVRTFELKKRSTQRRISV
jgi:hypothetical protein